MKGKLLTVDEILKLDDKYVYIEPIEIYKIDEGKAKVKICNDYIFFFPINNRDNPWNFHKESSNLKNGINLKIYEWIKETKTYYGDEILKMIRECKLEENPMLIGRGKSAGTLEMFLNSGIVAIKGNEPFEIYKEKEYMTFIEAIKTGTKFKYKSWDNYDTLEEAIYDLSNLSNEQIGEMIKEKAWEVQE